MSLTDCSHHSRGTRSARLANMAVKLTTIGSTSIMLRRQSTWWLRSTKTGLLSLPPF